MLAKSHELILQINHLFKLVKIKIVYRLIILEPHPPRRPTHFDHKVEEREYGKGMGEAVEFK